MKVGIGQWWWSSSQRARLLLWRSKFKSRWSLQFFCKVLFQKNENKQKEARVGPFFKHRNKVCNWTIILWESCSLGGSCGLVVNGGDSQQKNVSLNPCAGYWIDFHIKLLKICIFWSKRLKLNEKEAEVGPFRNTIISWAHKTIGFVVMFFSFRSNFPMNLMLWLTQVTGPGGLMNRPFTVVERPLLSSSQPQRKSRFWIWQASFFWRSAAVWKSFWYFWKKFKKTLARNKQARHNAQNFLTPFWPVS